MPYSAWAPLEASSDYGNDPGVRQEAGNILTVPSEEVSSLTTAHNFSIDVRCCMEDESQCVANCYYYVVLFLKINSYKFRGMSKHCYFNSIKKQNVNFQILQIIK